MLYETEEGLLEFGERAAKLASLNVASNVVSLVIYGITFITVARLLGPSAYGVYVVAVGIVGAINMTSDLGIGMYLSRHVAYLGHSRGREAVSAAIGDAFALLIIAIAAVVLLGLLLAHSISSSVFHSASYASLIYVTIATAIFMILYAANNSVLIGFGDGVGIAASSIIYVLAQAAGSIGLVLLGYGVMGAVSGLMLGAAAGAAAGFLLWRRQSAITIRINGIWKRLKELLSFSLPVAVSNFLIPVAGAGFMGSLPMNISLILLGIFSQPAVVGNYGVATRVAAVILSVMGSTTIAMLPIFSAMVSKEKGKEHVGRLYGYAIYAGLLFLAPIVAYFFVFSWQITLTVFPSYGMAYIFIAIMAAGALLQMPGAYANSLLVGQGKIRKIFGYAAMGGVVEVLLLATLIPIAGAIGAIVALYIVGSLIVDYLYVREVASEGLRIDYSKIARVLISSAVLSLAFIPVLLLNASSTTKLFIGLVMLALLYPPIVALLGAFRRDDMELLRGAAKKIPVLGKVLQALFGYAAYFMG